MITFQPQQLAAQGSPARTPVRIIFAGLAVAVAVFGAATTVSTVLSPGWVERDQGWLQTIAIMLAVVYLLLTATRLGLAGLGNYHSDGGKWTLPWQIAWHAIPPLVGAGLGWYLQVLWFNSTSVLGNGVWSSLSQLLVVPPPGANGQVWVLLGEAVLEAQTAIAPVVPQTSFVAAAAFAITGIYLLADSAFFSRLPALVILPVVALWIPALGFGYRIAPFGFIVSIVGVMAAWAFWQAGRGVLRLQAPRADVVKLAFAVTSVVGLVVGVGWQTSVSADKLQSGRLFPIYGEVTSTLSFANTLDLTTPLGIRSDEVAFRYTGGVVGPFRLNTMSRFDGATWQAASSIVVRNLSYGPVADGGDFGLTNASASYFTQNEAGEFIPIAFDSETHQWVPVAEPEATSIIFTFENLSGVALPVTGDPRHFITDSLVRYDATNDRATWPAGINPGDQLELLIYPREITRQALLDAHAAWPADEPPFSAIDAIHLELSPQAESIREIALQVPGVTTATDQLGVAQAIQQYLRNPDVFTYSATAPTPESGDMVLDFLTQREGYCVHFASAMVLMARTLDIPARLAIGYLPGVPEGDSYVVYGRDAHAWPELYFTGWGWVRFEPTPAAVTGLPPTHTITYVQDTYIDEMEAFLLDSTMMNRYLQYLPEAARDPYSANAAQDGHSATVRTEFNLNWLYLPAGLAILALLGWGVIVVRRRRHVSEELAFARAANIVKKRTGQTIPDHATPRQLPVFAESAWVKKHGKPSSPEFKLAVNSIANAVEAVRYQGAPGLAPEKLRAALKAMTK
jgi:transglutaminase-like putative cysteine protease